MDESASLEPSDLEAPARRRRRRWIVVALVAVLVAGGGLAARRFMVKESAAKVPSVAVQQGEFVISLALKGGELEAVKSENITAPQVRGELKIVKLFPEGETVQVGDLLIEFEPTEYNKRVVDAQQAVEAAKAELEKTRANQKADMARLEADIKDQEANLKLAQLQVEKMAFEATVEKERAQIDAKKAQLSYDQAVGKLEAQKIINAADVRKQELEISRAERELEKAQKDLAAMAIKAEKPGLVVYGKVWKGERPEKIRVGDNVWGGVNVISLPDLSRMQVKTYTNEVDVDKLKVGQKASMKLDALPEPTFHGAITSIASLGREKEGEKNVKVFDVTVGIEEVDSRLKPGMSATSTVVIETIPPAAEPSDSVRQQASAEKVVQTQPLPVFIPLDAVFEKNNQTVVYRMEGGKPEAQPVKLGKKNDNYVIIEEGLAPDDRVALKDPTQTLEGGGAGTEEKGQKEEGVKIQ
jgi:multidrug resistance efflux pump